MRLPTYSQPGFAPFFFHTENWDVFILRDPSRKRKFQTFCEIYMDRVRRGESNGEEIEKFTALLKGEQQPEYFRLARGVVPEFRFGGVVKPCNQHVERIVCSLHDLIVRPSMVHPPSNNNRGGGEERNLAVDQAAADKEALANVMFGPGMDWASNKRMKRLLDSTIELGFPPTTTSTVEEAQTGYPTLRDALGLRIDVEVQGSGVLESGPSSAVDEGSIATSSQESGGAAGSPSKLALDELSLADTRAGKQRPSGL